MIVGLIVMPAQADIQKHLNFLGSRVRGNDETRGFSDLHKIVPLHFEFRKWRS